jgi:hypothetical protein
MAFADAARRREYNKQYNAANTDKIKDAKRRYRDSGKERDTNLRKRYGISAAEYDAMLVRQNNCCAICGSATPGGKGTFHVDHCHNTGAVRGLLCNGCNVGLGAFKDNKEALTRAIKYLDDA